jgi:hypothetical protein
MGRRWGLEFDEPGIRRLIRSMTPRSRFFQVLREHYLWRALYHRPMTYLISVSQPCWFTSLAGTGNFFHHFLPSSCARETIRDMFRDVLTHVSVTGTNVSEGHCSKLAFCFQSISHPIKHYCTRPAHWQAGETVSGTVPECLASGY